VRDIIFQRLPRTLEIAIICFIIAIIIGTKLGLITGSKRNKLTDKSLRFFTYITIAIPPFIFAIMFSQLSAYENLFIFPAWGYKSPGMPDPPAITNARILDCILSGSWVILADYLHHLVIPMTAMIIFQLSVIFRHSRSSMIGVLQDDYIRTARAKGCTEKMVVNNHALKNALGPSVTMISFAFPKIFAGFIALEVAFQMPGIGDLFYRALLRGDYAIVIPIIFLVSIIVLILNLIADIIYAALDPRIRLR
jgi:peptide/nickel transport system permease protein